MEYIYINGNSTVAVERDDKNVTKVFIDNKEYEFKKDDKADKEQFAIQVKRNKYKKFLENQNENFIVLTGAGSSKDVGGKLLSELWDDTSTLLSEKKLNRLCELSHYYDKDSSGKDYIKNLEKLLSLASAAKEFVTDPEIDIKECINKIQTLIKKECELTLP